MSNFSASLHLWHSDQKPSTAFDHGGGTVGVKLPVGDTDITIFTRDLRHAELLVAALNYQIKVAEPVEKAA